jgi:cytosine deaminase
MAELVLRDVRLLEAAGAWDVGIAGGVVATVAPAGSLDGPAMIDAEGRLCSGAFVDGHVHLDKSYLWEIPGFTGKVAGPFFDELTRFKATSTTEAVTARMRRALEAAVLAGTGTLRAQIDVDDVVGLTHLDAALALRDEFAPWLRVQVVAFPQEGVAGNPAAGEVVAEALRRGADVMGGAHGFDRSASPAEHYGACFALATAHDVDVDVHLDFDTTATTPLAQWDLSIIARLTAEHGWQGRVTVAHLVAHGGLDEAGRRAVAELLLANDISLTVVPGAELYAAHGWSDPPLRDWADVTADWVDLIARGVRLSYAGGHLADAFHPFGEGDLLRDGLLLSVARGWGEPSLAGVPVLTLGTTNPARSARVPGPHGVVPGAVADLVVFDAPDAATALRHQSDRWLVVHAGRPVARTRTSKEFLR